MSIDRARVARFGALALALFVAAGCGTEATEGGGGSGGSGGSGGGAAPVSLSFSDETFTMLPAESRTLTLTAKPPGVYRVRFALLGDARDAALSASEVDTDASGTASVELTAPTESTTFTLRASAGESFTTAGVSVSANGFATLQVERVYSGKRSASYWVASVRTGTTCAKLASKPLDDGDLKGTSVMGNAPHVENVPIGPALAVTLRGAWSIAGCLDVASVRAGTINKVSVAVSDLPMQLSETDLELALGIETASANEWSMAFEDLAAIVIGGLRDGAADDVAALLAAMQDATASQADAAAFAAISSAENWQLVATGALGGKFALSNQIGLWLADGSQALGGSDTFSGTLHPNGKEPGKATLELASVAGLAPLDAGFRVNNDDKSQWTAEPGDNVLFGVRLAFVPSHLATALVEAPALSEVPAATTVAEALAEKIGCGELGAALVATGPNAQESFAGCNLACTTALCEQALGLMWSRARAASMLAPEPAWVDVTATGAAVVDDHARPVSFDGSWVGGLSVKQTTVPLSGPAKAALPAPPS